MATQETQQLDEVVVSTRRKMLAMGGIALAGLAAAGLVKSADAQAVGDTDILNFALNLEYLEANFYTLATQGVTIDQVGIGIGAGTTTAGTPSVITKPGGAGTPAAPGTCLVPWAFPVVQAYANETATEERTHVTFLRTALGAATVVQPQLDLYNSFIALGNAVGVSNFDPFASDANFLLGAYIFEDVGVTAYAGAAGLISLNAYLVAAAGILAVEAYHAGLVRTSIFQMDVANGNTNLQTLTQKISAVRANDGVGNDDIGVSIVTTPLNSASTTAQGVTIADVNVANSLAYTRTTSAVLQVVTGATTSPYKGTFFPQGMNGLIK